jgi:OOP family OmpA-OmpF porin
MSRNFAIYLAGNLLLALLAAPAQAEGWYAGAGLGASHIKDDATGNGYTINRDSSSTGFKLYGGYRIKPEFAIEAAYSNLGKETFNWRYSANESGAGDIKLQAVSLSAVGTLPLKKGFDLFGKIGIAQVKGKYHESWSQPGYAENIDINKSKAVANYGVGVVYNIDQHLGVRAEYEGFGKVKAAGLGTKSQLLSVGLTYQF